MTLLAPRTEQIYARPAVAGSAHLRFSRAASRTILERSYATSPVKLFSTRNQGPACWVYSATLGGGLVGGDAVRMTLEAAEGTRAVLATQASTKVYRSLLPASQSLAASVEDNALLAVVPDPIVCFAGADFSQEQRFELSPGASLVAVDWMTSGRHAVGERWIFTRYKSRLDIRRDGRRVLYDGLVLEDDAVSIAERMRGFQVFLTASVTGPLVSEGARAMIDAVSRLPVLKRQDLIESASAFGDDGALLRMAGMSVEDVGGALRERLSFLQPLLGGDPWGRKW